MGVRTGDEYLAGLRTDRRVYADGALVRDVTGHPAFARSAAQLARVYDLQVDARYRDALTFPSPGDGADVSTSFLMATTPADIERRIAGESTRAGLTYGLMGRLPDYTNAFLTDLAALAPLLARADPECGARMLRYWAFVRDADLTLTHALADPPIDKAAGVAGQGALRVVGESAEGLVVHGCKLLATLAPISDEILVGPQARRKPGEEAYALVAAVPVGSEGVKLITREPYDRGRSAFDRPLSGRFDEHDSLVMFERVLVPWDRVFLFGDIDNYNRLLPACPGYHLLQAVIRATAKLRFVSGLCAVVAERNGRAALPRYQELVGELLGHVELAEGIVVVAAEELARNAASPLPAPGDEADAGRTARALAAVRLFFPRAQQLAADALRLVGSSGLVMTPTEADLRNPEIGPELERYLPGADGSSAERRIRTFKLAWDLLGEQFGSRSLLYEHFFAGDPVANRMLHWHLPVRAEAMAVAERLIDETPPDPRPPAGVGPGHHHHLEERESP